MNTVLTRRRVPMTRLGSDARRDTAAGAFAAALAAFGVMLLLRLGWQVRSIPERVMEWLLLFVPPSVFEAGLQWLGFDAKRYGLYAAIVLMFVLAALLGYWVVRRGWPMWAIASLGPVLWLVVMLIVMPLTSAGWFAQDLVDGKYAAMGGYLSVGLTYAAVLALTRVWLSARLDAAQGWQKRYSGASEARLLLSPGTWSTPPRRTALGLLGGALISYVGTGLAVRLLPKHASIAEILLMDPQEPVPSGGIDPLNPHPNVVEGSEPQIVPTPMEAVASNSSGAPEPSAYRQLARDKDGAVMPAGRTPGQAQSPITSNADFYVVTKNAGGDPIIHPSDWRLLVDGEVPQSFQLDYATLRRLPAVEVIKTLECISNFVGKPDLAPFGAELISTAVWTGVPVREILGLTGGPKAEAAWVAVLGADEFTSALPLDVVMDPATLLVYQMNGEVLPREHGYPARLLVPDRYGMKNAKWVIGLRLMRREFSDWYGQRNWSKTAIVQTMSRIDQPAPDAILPPGTHQATGIAYAGSRDIARVEFRTDDGTTWQTATLAD
ncbi:MAG: molybdopterin-dependent oxidoreductase, partial [Chloroflexi bacterium]|nr:molybdopterin-dependent oxidoreductase [Chloroflexota bacterium]